MYLVIVVLHTDSRTQFGIRNSVPDQSSIHSYVRPTFVERDGSASTRRFQQSFVLMRLQPIHAHESVGSPRQVRAAGKRIDFVWNVVSADDLELAHCFEDVLRRGDVLGLEVSKYYEKEVAGARQAHMVLNNAIFCHLLTQQCVCYSTKLFENEFQWYGARFNITPETQCTVFWSQSSQPKHN